MAHFGNNVLKILSKNNTLINIKNKIWAVLEVQNKCTQNDVFVSLSGLFGIQRDRLWMMLPALITEKE